MGQLACDAVNYLQLLLSVYHHLLTLQSPRDLQSITKLHSGDSYDFIIVGGGTAGCVVANRLSEIRQWKVLLLEAGQEEPFEARIPAFGNDLKLTHLDWQFWTQPQKNACGGQPCQWPRGKVLGGGSAINDMIYNRGNKYDFETWASLGNTGWDYEHVLPYYRKSEHNLDEDIAKNQAYHSLGGYQSIGRFPYRDDNIPLMIKGYMDLGLKVVDFNGAQVLGAAHLQATQYRGERRSTNRAFLEPIRDYRANLRIVTNVRVLKILINPETKTAYGVEYVGEKDKTFHGQVFARMEVILSAGSINSPHLLMLSGVGLKETLEPLGIPVIKNLSVGYNLQDHVGASGVNFIVGNSTRPNVQDIIRDSILYAKPERTGGWAGIGSLSVTSYINSRYADTSIDFPDIQFSTIPSLARVNDDNFCNVTFDVPWCYYNRITFMPSVLRPKSIGYLTINTTDPYIHPLLYPKYFDNPQDMELMIEGFNAVAKMAETKTFKENGFVLDKTPPPRCKDLEFGTDKYWICAAEETTHSNFHPVGTCKMGPATDSEAVVDPKLKVYGIRNLRVIDSSIMPTVTSGNTNAPSIMIGEKGADLVKESYGIKPSVL